MVLFFFFFQAEDGIRDDLVTGVQTCALPIYADAEPQHRQKGPPRRRRALRLRGGGRLRERRPRSRLRPGAGPRSEERRVGKECRSRNLLYHLKKNYKILYITFTIIMK